MFHSIVTAALQNIQGAYQIRIRIGMRVLQGVAHARLCGEMHHTLWPMLLKRPCDGGAILQVGEDVGVAGVLLKAGETGTLEGDIIIVVEVIYADHLVTALEQTQGEGGANKASRTGDQYLHVLVTGRVPRPIP